MLNRKNMKLICIFIIIGFRSFGQTDSVMSVNMSKSDSLNITETFSSKEKDSLLEKVGLIVKEINDIIYTNAFTLENEPENESWEELSSTSIVFTFFLSEKGDIKKFNLQGCYVNDNFTSYVVKKINMINKSYYKIKKGDTDVFNVLFVFNESGLLIQYFVY